MLQGNSFSLPLARFLPPPHVMHTLFKIHSQFLKATIIAVHDDLVLTAYANVFCQGWQKRLSQLQVAQFPWDPKPETPAPLSSIPQHQQPGNVMNYQHAQQAQLQHQHQQHQQHQQSADTPPMSHPQPGMAMPQMPQLPQMPQMQPLKPNDSPRIKSEPGLENGQGMVPNYSNAATSTAQQRAAQNLQATYGARAQASIAAIHQGQPPQHSQQSPQLQLQQLQQQQQQQRTPTQQIPRPSMTPAQYQAAMHQQTRIQQQNQGGVNGAQTDGSGDVDDNFVGVMKTVDDNGEEVIMGRVAIDNMIRKQIEARGQAMEGGGLMLPLKERLPTRPSKKRKMAPGSSFGGAHNSSLTAGPSQMDGGDDDDLDDEDDDDAINSDLDDPDDLKSDDSDAEDGVGQIMLCMYDKVQRVKNKWLVLVLLFPISLLRNQILIGITGSVS
jgi:transcription initiation factor TFIIA large subunit